jgi:hypothetical protein
MGLPCAPRSGTTNLQETDNIFDMSILFKWCVMLWNFFAMS